MTRYTGCGGRVKKVVHRHDNKFVFYPTRNVTSGFVKALNNEQTKILSRNLNQRNTKSNKCVTHVWK